MSDDDETIYIKKPKNIHYGSLEEVERQRLIAKQEAKKNAEALAADPNAKQPAAPGTESGGNIFTSKEYMAIDQSAKDDRDMQIAEIERQTKVRLMGITTDDGEVKKSLRILGVPVCYFGEGPADRRNRLKELISQYGDDILQKKQREVEELRRKDMAHEPETTWYHEGPEALRIARLWMAEYSLPRARNRLQAARDEKQVLEATRTARTQELLRRIRGLAISASQVGDSRPLPFCQFSPSGDMLATASWSGLIKLWSIPDCGAIRTLRGHGANATGLAFHPQATISLDENDVSLASCGADGSVKLWNMKSEEPMADVEGHAPYRVSRVAFHPSGRFLATCVHDHSWRLWDLEQQTEVLHQEGHAKPVYCIDFHTDGSLAATGGLDAFGRVWDLRTGRCIMFMEGHLKGIIGINCHVNGYLIATGSEDNTCKIWDLRKRACLYTIPAHTNLVSSVKFDREGQFLVTGSYDCTAKVWSDKTYQPLKTLSGHDGKIMGMDISPDGKTIATCSYDRTFKLWNSDT